MDVLWTNKMRIISVLSFGAILAFYAGNTVAVELETPARIARLIEQMPCEVPGNGDFRCTELSGTLLLYSESNYGVVSQVGVHLFPEALKGGADSLIYKRIERLWLELLLRKTTDSQKSLLKEYGIRMVYDGYPLGSGAFRSLDTALDLMRSSSSISLTTGGNEIDFLSCDTSGNTLHIYLPADRDLISPYDKKEAEELLWSQLSAASDLYVPQAVGGDDVIDAGTGLYVSGGECYMIDSLRNDVFFQKRGNTYSPVFSPSYPVESMRNMLMGVLPYRSISGKSVSLRFKAYNRNLGSIIDINLGTLLMFFRMQGLHSYTARYEESGDTLKCLLVLHNPICNYLHMMVLEVGKSALFAKGSVPMMADMSMFIPQHNIKALFNEFNNNKIY